MLNQSADYALRAVLFLARRDGPDSCKAGEIAEATGVPRNYLGKVLHTLARAGVLHSERGPHGGFRLAVWPYDLTLQEVVAPFHRLPQRQVCLLGNGPCDPSHPCDVHRHWQGMASQITHFFTTTTIGLMLEGGGVAVGIESSAATGACPADPF